MGINIGGDIRSLEEHSNMRKLEHRQYDRKLDLASKAPSQDQSIRLGGYVGEAKKKQKTLYFFTLLLSAHAVQLHVFCRKATAIDHHKQRQ